MRAGRPTELALIEDLVTPSAADLEAIRELVDRVIAAGAAKINTPRKKAIPPPPKRT